MKAKKTVRVDLTGCKYYLEIFERIRLAFGFDEGFGCNWQAFWDSLHIDSDAEHVEVIGAETLPEEWQESLKTMRFFLEEMRKRWADTDYPFSYVFLPADSATD